MNSNQPILWVFLLIGVVGLVSFLLQWEYVLVSCEALCLVGFAWLLFSKKIPVRTLPLLMSTLVLGFFAFSQMGVGNWANWIWPRGYEWLPDAEPQEELSAIAHYMLYRPFTWFYRIADALTGLCFAGILLPWFRHLAENSKL